ncbi:MAG TPA: nuclear transport factor 2 family protein [Gemmatimonadales bacterium]|nr:nuclear transport factor 2 family protein [Gemmatimonadales bacterium]
MHTPPRWSAATALLVALLAGPGMAQSTADSAGIRSAALDYIEGWYAGDATRMERALHPELAKRMVQDDPKSHKSVLDHMGAKELVRYTREGGGRETPTGQRQADVSILDIYQRAASAKVIAKDWVDYLHLARWNGRWQIVNVLWELKPRQARAASR